MKTLAPIPTHMDKIQSLVLPGLVLLMRMLIATPMEMEMVAAKPYINIHQCVEEWPW